MRFAMENKGRRQSKDLPNINFASPSHGAMQMRSLELHQQGVIGPDAYSNVNPGANPRANPDAIQGPNAMCLSKFRTSVMMKANPNVPVSIFPNIARM
jgi:hypothetical protein